ncbi:DNA repair protein RecO [bacterium]|nr:MAG: DNA repair protein RecO [bacterium]
MYTKYTGVILKRCPLGEADEMLTIYTKQVGKLRVRTVSSRKIKSRLAGSLQTLNEIDFETAGRSSGRGDGLPVLISVRTRTFNNYLRENLGKFAHALVGVETLYRLVPDHEGNEPAYGALIGFLRSLENTRQESREVRLFQLKLLQYSGYAFPIACLTCQKAVVSGGGFVTAKGGMVCSSCQGDERPDLILDSESVSELSGLVSGSPAVRLRSEVERVVEGFLHYVLEREIRSRKFVEAVAEE